MNAPLLGIAQVALDRALRLDPQAGSILAPLAGKRVAVHVVGAMPARFVVQFAHDRILLEHQGEGFDRRDENSEQADGHAERELADADVTIIGSAGALALLARGAGDLPSTAQVSVRGDIALLQQVRSAIVRLRPDFDEPLARLIGDELAWPLSRAARQVASFALRSARELGDDVKEFLGEESGLLAERDALQDFGDEVDGVRDALARLEKRVSRLARATHGERGEASR